MPWSSTHFPPAMAHLPELVRAKAIEIANALLEEGYEEGRAIRIAIAQAKRWGEARGIGFGLEQVLNSRYQRRVIMASPRSLSPFGRRPLGSDELADLDEQFDECDADGDQRIDFGEFSQLLENLGSEVPPGRRRSCFDAIDLDRDGAIDRSEFMEWWRSER